MALDGILFGSSIPSFISHGVEVERYSVYVEPVPEKGDLKKYFHYPNTMTLSCTSDHLRYIRMLRIFYSFLDSIHNVEDICNCI